MLQSIKVHIYKWKFSSYLLLTTYKVDYGMMGGAVKESWNMEQNYFLEFWRYAQSIEFQISMLVAFSKFLKAPK